MLVAFWSPKGGSGTSVVAAACAITLAGRRGAARLADLGGDQPGILGLAPDPATGLLDWLAAAPGAPADALDRLGVAVAPAPGLVLVPRGSGGSPLAPRPAAQAGAALAAALRSAAVPTVVDVGDPAVPAARALVEGADVSVLVLRPCYLGLRRAARSPLLAGAAGVALVDEPGRGLTTRDVEGVLSRSVVARFPVRGSIARAVDAGVLASRLPDALERPAVRIVERLVEPGAGAGPG